MKKNLIKMLLSVSCYFLFCGQCFAESELHKTLTSQLQDGVYIVEMVNFMPSQFFDTEEQAKAWVEAVKRNPNMVKPEHNFLQLHLEGSNFIIRQLTKTSDGGYEPQGNLFLSVLSDTSWVFEEAANRVTIVTNMAGLENAGSVAGILKGGDSYCEIFRNLGLSKISSSSINEIDSNQFTGKYIDGRSFDGVFHSNAQGRITNIVCNGNGSAESYDLNFDIFYDEVPKQISKVTICTRQAHEQLWRNMVQYVVKNSSPLMKNFEMDQYWKQFTNSHTLLVYFDSKSKTTTIRETNGKTHLLRKSEQIDNGGFELKHKRWFVLVILGLSTIFGAYILIMSLKTNRKCN